MKFDPLKDQNEIKGFLRQRGCYSDKECNRLASIIFSTYGPTDKDGVNKAIELLDKESSTKKEEPKYKLETNTILLSEITKNLGKELQPIRLKLFGDEKPPFSNFDDSLIWIDSEMKKVNLDEVHKKYSLFDKARKDINSKIDSGEIYGDYLHSPLKYGITHKKEINKTGCTIRYNDDYAFCKTENGNIYGGTHFVYHSPELLTLATKINELSLTHSLDEYELLNLFMCGTIPDIKRWESLVHVVDGKKARFQININSPDLTFDELKTIYNDYRREMNVKSKKRFSPKQERIIELINEVGEPPDEKGRSDYFKELLLRWNSKYPDNKYSTWQALYKAYNSIQESLKRMEV